MPIYAEDPDLDLAAARASIARFRQDNKPGEEIQSHINHTASIHHIVESPRRLTADNSTEGAAKKFRFLAVFDPRDRIARSGLGSWPFGLEHS